MRNTFLMLVGLTFLLTGTAAEARKLSPMEKALCALNAPCPDSNTVAASSSAAGANTNTKTAIAWQAPVFVHPAQTEAGNSSTALAVTQLSDPLGLTTNATADIINLVWFNPWIDRSNTATSSSNVAAALPAIPLGGAMPMAAPGQFKPGQGAPGQGGSAMAMGSLVSGPGSNTGTAWSKFAGYLVYKNKPGDPPVQANAFPMVETQYRDITITANTTYQYRVVAIDASGATLTSSQQILACPLPSLPPDSVKDLDATTDDERVSLKWTKVNPTSRDLAGYIVFRSASMDDAGVQLNLSPTAKIEYNDDSGETNRTYYYRVAAVDSKGLTGNACTPMSAHARPRSRSGLVLASTAYPGLGRLGPGFTGDMQFLYYIGTLYGLDHTQPLPNSTTLDPISMWLLNADMKYSLITEQTAPLSLAVGGRGGVLLQLAGQPAAGNANFSFSAKSQFDYIWGGYLALSKSFGPVGVHAGWMQGNLGNPVFRLSKYLDQETPSSTVYVGTDFPIMRRMNSALEVLYPLNTDPHSGQHPFLANLHVDRLLNFDVSYLHWDRGWAFLGYFNIRFTVFPSS